MDSANKTSTRFREVREKLDLTQQQLADELSLSRNYIAQIETGKREPTVRVLNSLEALVDRKRAQSTNRPALGVRIDPSPVGALEEQPADGSAAYHGFYTEVDGKSGAEAAKEFGMRLHSALDEKSLTTSDLMVGLRRPVERIMDWLQGKDFPRANEVRELAKFLDTTPAWLLKGERAEHSFSAGAAEDLIEVRQVPVISWTHAGTAATYEEMPKHFQGRVGTNSRDPKAFALTIEGDSMEPKFLPGDKVVCEPTHPATNGKTVVVKFVNDAVQLRIYTMLPNGKIRLAAYNPAYPAVEHTRKEFHWIFPVKELVRSV